MKSTYNCNKTTTITTPQPNSIYSAIEICSVTIVVIVLSVYFCSVDLLNAVSLLTNECHQFSMLCLLDTDLFISMRAKFIVEQIQWAAKTATTTTTISKNERNQMNYSYFAWSYFGPRSSPFFFSLLSVFSKPKFAEIFLLPIVMYTLICIT